MADEKFRATVVKLKMEQIENHFTSFSSTLKEINSYIEANVNASIASSVFGDLGSKLINVWNYNSSTFNDFHDHFDVWAQVVAVITANNNEFAVNAAATYRDNVGTLDGVKEARSLIKENGDVKEIAKSSGFSLLSNEAKNVLNYAYRAVNKKITNNNIYGGKTVTYTDATGAKVEVFFDNEGYLVGTNKFGCCYGPNDEVIKAMPTAAEYKEKKDRIIKAREEAIAKEKEEEERRKKEEEEKKRAEEEKAKLAQKFIVSEKSGYVFPFERGQSAPITSHVGHRSAPTAGASTNHKGTDIGVPTGTKIYSISSGTVAACGRSSAGGFGNWVMIKQDDGRVVKYGHVSKSNFHKVGDRVEAGELIALSGNEGISTGPHLHLQIETANGGILDSEDFFSDCWPS